MAPQPSAPRWLLAGTLKNWRTWFKSIRQAEEDHWSPSGCITERLDQLKKISEENDLLANLTSLLEEVSERLTSSEDLATAFVIACKILDYSPTLTGRYAFFRYKVKNIKKW